jgi:hypothetical protein
MVQLPVSAQSRPPPELWPTSYTDPKHKRPAITARGLGKRYIDSYKEKSELKSNKEISRHSPRASFNYPGIDPLWDDLASGTKLSVMALRSETLQK